MGLGRALRLVVCALLFAAVMGASCGCKPPEPAAPVVKEWSVSPSRVSPGEVVTIRWEVSNVERVIIEPFGEVAASGELQDAPQKTLRYSLSASNARGSAQRSQEVVVEEAEPSATPTARETARLEAEATKPLIQPEPSHTPTETATPTPTSTLPPPVVATLPPPVVATVPVLPPPVVISPTPIPEPTWQHPVTLLDQHNFYHLRLVKPGQIRVRATWSGTAANLALIINGPGQVGYYARKDGASPLEVVYNVTEDDLKAGNEWRVSVVNFGSGRADGTLTFTYPSGSSDSPFVNAFVNEAGYATSMSVIVLKRVVATAGGTISGKATWSGSPGNLALIINGPGKVGYYAREDGSSPLSVEYEATAADLSHGDTWRVSLTSFDAANAQGEIELNYPYQWLLPVVPILVTPVSP